MTQFETKAEDRIPLSQMLIYGAGAFVNNLLAGSIGAMMIVLNLGLGMNPALVGLLGALPRLFDAITDPLMGYISDNTKSRWGRRRPYIFIGAILASIVFVGLWQFPRGQSESFYFWYFLIGSLLFYLAYTVFATPWVALGYELTPDYHERTRLMGVQNFIGQLAYFIPPWLLLIMQYDVVFDDMVDGAAGTAVVIGMFVLAVGILPAIFLRERTHHQMGDGDGPRDRGSFVQSAVRNVVGFATGFLAALRFVPFLKLCLATFLVFNGFILISSFQTYVIIYYVFSGDQVRGAEYAGYAGTVGTLSTFLVIGFVTWLGTRVGKRTAFGVATAVSMVGYGLKWFCYNPDIPVLVILPAPLIAFGLGGLFTLMPAMIADVVDLDELKSGERREGMFGSIYWWVVKLGMAAALAGGGILLNATGFDVALEGNQTADTIVWLRLFDAFIPVICSGIAIWTVATFSITQNRAHEVREELERIRGNNALATS
ncbi:MAG: MFS transporter [Pseudomonadota bacterium]